MKLFFYGLKNNDINRQVSGICCFCEVYHIVVGSNCLGQRPSDSGFLQSISNNLHFKHYRILKSLSRTSVRFSHATAIRHYDVDMPASSASVVDSTEVRPDNRPQDV